MTGILNWKLIGPLAMLAGLLHVSSIVNQASIEERGSYRYIYSNSIPNHSTGTFPNATWLKSRSHYWSDFPNI
ncbi:MAG: hypothetical protein AAFV90_29330 [Cyanobacteria bacterium J06634_5]